ncbi:MAG: DUF2156 domain-containing protein [Desulfobulbaceae bacterium]
MGKVNKKEEIIPDYPQSTEFSLALRPRLHPLLQQLPDGISEFTFANLYLFREGHHYRLALLPDGHIVITGRDNNRPFFMLPFGLPARDILQTLFAEWRNMKCVSAPQAQELLSRGYTVREDRDNFDYLYRRQDLAELTGRKFSQKRNHIKAFINNYDYRGEPLIEAHLPAALAILDQWRAQRDDAADYGAAREALEKSEELQLCGGIYYADDRPVAYSLGEELMLGHSFAIHFEKAVSGYKGVWQFVNQAFASILPDKYETVNREQDLGDEGLRAAKLSYKPAGFVMKYRATAD